MSNTISDADFLSIIQNVGIDSQEEQETAPSEESHNTVAELISELVDEHLHNGNVAIADTLDTLDNTANAEAHNDETTAESTTTTGDEYHERLEELRSRLNGLINETSDTAESVEEEEQTEEEDNEEVEASVPEVYDLPENSKTLEVDETTARFSGAEWYEAIKTQNILIGGAGGIGSWLAFEIARLHPASIYLYDDDEVELVNMAGQFYNTRNVGDMKVYAMEHTISNYAGYCINAIASKFTSFSVPGDIMLCGFDSMASRKVFFNSWRRYVATKSTEEKQQCLFMDGRLSMDTLQIYCIRGDDEYNIRMYANEALFSDEMADHTVCSAKQTTYLATMIGSLMTNLLINFVANQCDPVIPYTLPYFTEYNSQRTYFNFQM